MQIKTIFYNIIVLYLLVEIASMVMIEGFNYTEPPLFRQDLELTDTIQNEYPQVADIDSAFGVWHIPNAHFRHVKACFDVTYYYNSIGARDIERSKKSTQSRVMLIGDSFAEGYGVDTLKRLSNLLEKDLKKEVLNFGTSGNFGSTQMSLLYQKFGKQYEHDIVLVGLLPRNDFIDDDYEKGKVLHEERYRPYLVRKGEEFELVYHVNKLENSTWHPSNIHQIKEEELEKQKGIKFFLRSYSYFYQILSYIKNVALVEEKREELNYEAQYVFYEKAELEILKYNLTQIKNTATENGAKVIAFTIPSIEDINYFKENQGAVNSLNEDLSLFAKENDITYLDLLPTYLKHDNPSDFFLECDGHWSEMGNEWAKEVIQLESKKVLRVGG